MSENYVCPNQHCCGYKLQERCERHVHRQRRSESYRRRSQDPAANKKNVRGSETESVYSGSGSSNPSSPMSDRRRRSQRRINSFSSLDEDNSDHAMRLRRGDYHRARRSNSPNHAITNLRLRLADLRSFTMYSGERTDMSARSFIVQFKREACMVGVPKSQWLNLMSFILKSVAHAWFLSNLNSFVDCSDFREAF